MTDVWLIGAHSTKFGKRPEDGFREIGRASCRERVFPVV